MRTFHNKTRLSNKPQAAFWCKTITVNILEAIRGERKLQNLREFMTKDVYQQVQRRCLLIQRGKKHRQEHQKIFKEAKVLKVRLVCPKSTAIEASLLVEDQLRTRAIALRLELRNECWVVTHFEIG